MFHTRLRNDSAPVPHTPVSGMEWKRNGMEWNSPRPILFRNWKRGASRFGLGSGANR